MRRISNKNSLLRKRISNEIEKSIQLVTNPETARRKRALRRRCDWSYERRRRRCGAAAATERRPAVPHWRGERRGSGEWRRRDYGGEESEEGMRATEMIGRRRFLRRRSEILTGKLHREKPWSEFWDLGKWGRRFRVFGI